MEYSPPDGAWQPPPPPYQADPADGSGNALIGYQSAPALPEFGTPRRKRWPFFVAGGVILLLGVVAAFVFFMIGLVRPAYDAANGYLAGLAAHDYEAAAGFACDGSSDGAQRAGEFLEQAGAIDGFNITSARLSTGFGAVGGSITIGGRNLGIGLDVGHGDEGWKVCDFSVAGLGAPPRA